MVCITVSDTCVASACGHLTRMQACVACVAQHLVHQDSISVPTRSDLTCTGCRGVAGDRGGCCMGGGGVLGGGCMGGAGDPGGGCMGGGDADDRLIVLLQPTVRAMRLLSWLFAS